MHTPEQSAADGSGPYLERRYYVDIAQSRLTADALMQYINGHVTDLAPNLLAEFEKVTGQTNELAVGHEFHIKILGPWNGSVRVTKLGDRFFELCTLEGHPEAGHIRFSVQELDDPASALRFEIHSWARSRDGLVAFAYSTLGVGKRVQEQTWVLFCEGVVAASGGQALSPVRVETIEQDDAGTRREHHTR
jgi:Domain of unknown function (DUF1990)